MKKILIATAYPAMNQELAAALPRYEAHICANGTDALELLETLRPDILVLDLALPGLDGLTVLEKSRFRPPRILAITNFINDYIGQTAKALGVQEIVFCSVTSRYLIQQLEALTEKVPSPEL